MLGPKKIYGKTVIFKGQRLTATASIVIQNKTRTTKSMGSGRNWHLCLINTTKVYTVLYLYESSTRLFGHFLWSLSPAVDRTGVKFHLTATRDRDYRGYSTLFRQTLVPTDAIPTVHSRNVGWLTAVEWTYGQYQLERRRTKSKKIRGTTIMSWK